MRQLGILVVIGTLLYGGFSSGLLNGSPDDTLALSDELPMIVGLEAIRLQQEPEDPQPTEAPPEPRESPQAPAPSPDTSGPSDGSESGDGGGVPWGWIGLGVGVVVLVVLLGAMWTSRPRGDRTQQSGWRDGALRAYASGAAIHDVLAVHLPGGGTTVAAPANRWRDVERRMDSLAAELHVLGFDPPSRTASDALGTVLASLTTLRSAVQVDVDIRSADASTESQIGEAAASAARRLSEFDRALATFKESI